MVVGILLSSSTNKTHVLSKKIKPDDGQNPNIILIIADDLGYKDVGFQGSTDILTPNIDKIANEGVRFTDAYVSYPVCGPSRAGIITGRYQDRFGFGRNPLFAPNDIEMGLPLTEETLAELLKKANYKNVALGKWHLGAHNSLRPMQRGFDDFFGFLSGGHSYFPDLWTLKDEFEIQNQFDAYNTLLLRDNHRVKETEYITDALSREAVLYIEKYQNTPFFMYLGYNAPHTPLQATQKYLDRYAHISDQKRRTYAAMISAMDDGIGKILNKLEDLSLTENTIVIFLSDNGGPEKANASDNGDLRGGKSDLFEGGIRVPLAIKWPKKITAGTVFSKPVISLDIFATIIAQTKEKPSTLNPLDGVNLLPYLNHENDSAPHEYLFWRKFDQQNYAVRGKEGLKWIGQKDKSTLFDLIQNKSEKAGLKLNDQKTSRKLYSIYKQWESQVKDPLFLGLLQDSIYNTLHPNRYLKTK